MTMSLVQTIEVGSGGANSVEFTSIPQDATDLLILMSARHQDAGLEEGELTFNSSASGYSTRLLQGSGSSVYTTSTSSAAFCKTTFVTDSAATANTFSNIAIYIPNYTSSAAKSISIDGVTENNATAARQTILAGAWTGTAAITSLKIAIFSTLKYAQNSSFSLYKITKA